MAINTRDDVYTNMAQGLGFQIPILSTTPIAATSGAAASGFLTVRLLSNAIGSSLPATVVDFPLPTGLSSQLYAVKGILVNASNGYYLARIYKFGTVNLAATGDQFTHDAATFPVTRTQLGAATKPLTLIPFLYITTSTATTPPAFILKVTAGGNGYVNQDGTGVQGTVTFTLPNAATVAQSGFVPILEAGDSGVQDISQIDVTVAGSAGAGTMYGIELLMPLGQNSGDAPVAVCDALNGGLALCDLTPAVATSGTVVSNLVVISLGTGSAAISSGSITGVLNV